MNKELDNREEKKELRIGESANFPTPTLPDPSDPIHMALRENAAKVNPNQTFVERLTKRLTRARRVTVKEQRLQWPSFHIRWPVWVGAAAAVILIVAFVSQILWPRGIPAIPETADVSTDGVPTAIPTPVYTPTPEPEPDFLADLPPAIVSTVPRSGEEVNLQAGILLRFTQPMDRASVESALQISPAVEGDFTWSDDTTVTFSPKKVLASGVRYQVALGSSARARNGLTLNQELAFAFSTIGPLTITHVSPANNALGERGNTPLLIAFNYPIVPINCTGQVAAGPALTVQEIGTFQSPLATPVPPQSTETCPTLPLTIEPVVAGQGMWINSSLYRFDPQPAWEAGTDYQVTIPQGIASVDGAILNAPLHLSFNTAPLQVQYVEPAQEVFNQDATNVPLETGVRVTFNTPVDQTASVAGFSLLDPQGNAVAGDITWENEGIMLVFTPTQQLALETRYTVVLDSRIRSRSGTPLSEPYRQSFITTPSLRVTKIGPPYENADSGVLSFYDGVRITFEGLLDSETVYNHIHVTHDSQEIDANLYPNTYEADNYVYVHWDKTSGETYCVVAEPGILDRYGNTLPGSVERCFLIEDMPSILTPVIRQDAMTLDAAEPARIYFSAVNLEQATFTLSSLPEYGFLGYREEQQGLQHLRNWTLTPGGERNETLVTPVDLAEGAALPTGYYYLEWQVPNRSDRMGYYATTLRFAVVDRHLTLKLSADEALVWVTDLRSGVPVAGAEARLLNSTGQELGRGITDNDGIARFAIPTQGSRWDAYTAVVGTPGQPGFGVVRSDWHQDVNPWNFDINNNYELPPTYRLYLHTDRPIYRPGQDVHFRGVVRNDDDNTYTLPPTDLQINVKLYASYSDDMIEERVFAPSDMGTFDGTFSLPDEATLGSYTLLAEIVNQQGENISVQIAVAAYRKPEFEVNVTPQEDNIYNGDTLRAHVEARYYAGGAVSNANVHWRLLARPYSFNMDARVRDLLGWWNWSSLDLYWYYWHDSEVIAEGDATTDAQGNLLLELPANLEPFYNDETAGAQSCEIEATVTDEANFPVTQSGNVTVHATHFYLGLKARSWVVTPNVPTTVDVLALDWDTQPVPQQTVNITLARRVWKQVATTVPFESPEWTYEDTVIDSFAITTDNSGAAAAEVTVPNSGPYVVIAETTDKSNNMVRSETSLWVSGPGAAYWRLPEGRIEPVADARGYKPGDVAHILLPTPFEAPYEVLMTVERDGILDVHRFTADTTNPLVDIPIAEHYVPNVIISFVLVKGIGASTDGGRGAAPDVRIGMVELEVEPVKQLLSVEIIPDCTSTSLIPSSPIPSSCTYAPGDTATLNVRTLDHTGAPVEAEVALAIVDKAVLALADETAPTLKDAFYSPRPLRVVTGDGLLMLHNRLATDIEALQERAQKAALEALYGGIGGGGGGDGMYAPDVRDEFPDTALWEAHLRTGPTGETQVTLKLPDSLTTWVVDARAVTADTRVGQTTAEFVVTKPLIVRPVTPRFFTAGDRAEIAAIIQNNTAEALEVDVSLLTNLQGSEEAVQQVRVEGNGRARVSWLIEVPENGTEWADLTFRVAGGGYQDAARPNVGRETDHALPIYRYETPDVVSTSGTLTQAGSRMEVIIVPPEAGSDSTLTVRLNPTLAAGMTEGLSYLEHFEHECTEQLVSRFLPNTVTYRALRDLGLTESGLETTLQELIADATARLATRQNYDGGWGWWSGEEQRSNFQTSAYAVLGLIHAQRAGFAIPQGMLDNAVVYVQQELENSLQAGTRALPQVFALYVLAEGGYTWPDGADHLLFEAHNLLNSTEHAYLALALSLKDPADTRITTLLESLRADAVLSASGAHWEDTESTYWVTWTRATSVALDALSRLASDDPLLPQAVRWLMAARAKDRWETTQENAWAIIALTDYMVATGELQADYEWGVALNIETLAEGQVTQETLRTPTEQIIPVNEMLRTWPNALEIARGEGNGTLYYTADLKLYRPVKDVAAESRGITVQRQYCVPETDRDNGNYYYIGDNDFGACTPISSAQPGDLVEVRLTLTLPHYRNYLLVEDYYPAGMEPVDPTLNINPDDVQAEMAITTRSSYWWWPHFEHEELRDERAVFYTSYLAPGTYQVRYYLRAAVPGTYNAIPTTASEMYFPEVWGRSDGSVFVIEMVDSGQ
ncbi:MAG: Ig-like domain-containing protein [Anaerolineae bacterium]|nr:Ig-like domain-containing protein [Anaerolineae bacterium]